MAGAPDPVAAAEEFRPGRILVQPRAGVSDDELARTVERAGGRVSGHVRGTRVRIVEVPARAEEQVARALARNPRIEFAEVDHAVKPEEVTANDPKFSSAWHLPQIGAPTAWSLSLGDGVVVAVLDTGVDAQHLDLESKLVKGWNSASGNNDTSDIYGHGTKVAGVIGAASDNGLGVTAVAWNSPLMPIRITNRSDGLAYASDIAAGITWAADNGARVANISYDVGGSSTIRSASQYLKNAGGLVFIAAGNTGGDPGYPSSQAHIAVAATTSSDGRASFSSTGAHLDLAAPGVSIWTTAKGDQYTAPNGTSFSSPVAAAAAALVMAVNHSLSADEVEAVLKTTAVDLGDPSWDPQYGFGRIDAGSAVALAAQAAPSDTTPPIVGITSPGAGETVSGYVAVDVSAVDDFGVSRVDLYAGTTLVGTDYEAPYAFAWDSTQVPDGAATLVAHARDAAGNEGRSTEVAVSVSNGSSGDTQPPVVTLTSPSDGATVSGTVTLSARATDDTAVAEVRITVDGRLMCAGSPSVSCNWNTRKESAGSHSVVASARDAAGNTASASAIVTVGASSPGGGGGSNKGPKKK